MSALDKIRQAFPDLQDASDSDLLGEISKLTGRPYESTATMLGVAPRGTASEVARQIGAGFAVDLPRMVGKGLQYTGISEGGGRALVEGAEERAPGWTPDMRGRGMLGEALVDAVINENPAEVDAIKAGNEKLLNFLTGKVMKSATTKPNPKQVTELLRARLL
jgi:hypothetical protein